MCTNHSYCRKQSGTLRKARKRIILQKEGIFFAHSMIIFSIICVHNVTALTTG